MSTPSPGWYPDQQDPRMVRWWNGQQWTSQVQPRSEQEASAGAAAGGVPGGTTPHVPPGHVDTPSTPRGAGVAITSLVIGLVSLLLAFIPIINNFAFVLALVGASLGVVALVRSRGGRRAGRGMALAGVLLAVLSLVGVLASQALYGSVLDKASKELDKGTGNATDRVLAEDLEVVLGQFVLTQKEFGLRETSLTVTLKNKSNQAKSFSVQVEGVDQNGTRVADDTGYAQNLGPGQSMQITLFTFVDEATAAKLQNAQFRVAEASAY